MGIYLPSRPLLWLRISAHSSGWLGSPKLPGFLVDEEMI